MHLSSRDRWTLALAIACAVALPSEVSAQQFVIFDQAYVHSPDLPDSHYRVDPTAQTPADLTSPVDYANGTVHLYMEVRTKPTDEPTRMQVCFEASPTYGCTSQSPIYTTTGLVEWSTDVSDFWSPGTPDWSMGSGRVAVILKDTENGKPSADNVGDELAARFTPTELHLILTWVAAGATYVPPTPDMDAGVAPMDAGTTDAGVVVDAGEAQDAATSVDAAEPDGGGGDPGVEGGGCSVGARAIHGARGSDSAAWLAAAVALLAWSRRLNPRST